MPNKEGANNPFAKQASKHNEPILNQINSIAKEARKYGVPQTNVRYTPDGEPFSPALEVKKAQIEWKKIQKEQPGLQGKEQPNVPQLTRAMTTHKPSEKELYMDKPTLQLPEQPSGAKNGVKKPGAQEGDKSKETAMKRFVDSFDKGKGQGPNMSGKQQPGNSLLDGLRQPNKRAPRIA